MATVIRAAKMLGGQVVLAAPGHGSAVAQERAAAPESPATSAAEAPAQAAPAGPGVPDPAAALLAGLEQRERHLSERERQLSERERQFEQEQEAQRRKVAEEAYREAYARGEEHAAAAQRERLDAIERVLAALEGEFAGGIAGLEDVMVGIAFEAICKIVCDTMHSIDGVRAVVRAVMAQVGAEEKLVLRLAPQDYQLLRQDRARLFGDGESARYTLAPDHRVALGGCLIETAGGTVDGRLETQIQKLRDTLAGARKMIVDQA